jgi:hypothetical protein
MIQLWSQTRTRVYNMNISMYRPRRSPGAQSQTETVRFVAGGSLTPATSCSNCTRMPVLYPLYPRKNQRYTQPLAIPRHSKPRAFQSRTRMRTAWLDFLTGSLVCLQLRGSPPGTAQFLGLRQSPSRLTVPDIAIPTAEQENVIMPQAGGVRYTS